MYHPDNVKLVSRDYKYKEDDIINLAKSAYNLGIQFKIGGIPFGAPYPEHRRKMHEIEEVHSKI